MEHMTPEEEQKFLAVIILCQRNFLRKKGLKQFKDNKNNKENKENKV